MLREKTNRNSARVGILAVALAVAGAIAITGAVPSPSYANPGSGNSGGGSSGGGGSTGGSGSGGGAAGSSNGGSSSSGDHGGGGGGEGPINCNTKKGWTYSPSKGICVHTGSLDDKELYQTGRALALAGHYDDAIITLDAIKDKHDAMVLTMIGFSKRKLGQVDEGMAYYQKALAIEPDNINTHEYLGEGYVAIGKVELAKLELDKLAKLCGTSCEQYEDLANAIEGKPEE